MKDGYYWVREKREESSEWSPLFCDENHVLTEYDSLPKEHFEIGDYIETPDKYK